MNNQDFTRVINANVSPKMAFDAISHVAEWWATDIEGDTTQLNDVFTVYFGDTFVTFSISETVPGEKIVWLVTDCNLHWLKDKKEWKGTQINWNIRNQDNGVQITMTHVGLVPGIECYKDCEKGWNFYVGESLYKLLTEHKGLPETPKNARVSTAVQG